jgi:hypothetical protein
VDYSDAGREQLRAAIVGALATRLKVNAYLQLRPELLKRPIKSRYLCLVFHARVPRF